MKKTLALVVAGTAEIGRNIIDSLINDGYLIFYSWFSNETVASDMKHRYQTGVLPVRLDLTSEQAVVQFDGKNSGRNIQYYFCEEKISILAWEPAICFSVCTILKN